MREKAVRTAAEIQRVVQGRKFAGVELVTRIGIHTGMVIAGNVGSGRARPLRGLRRCGESRGAS